MAYLKNGFSSQTQSVKNNCIHRFYNTRLDFGKLISMFEKFFFMLENTDCTKKKNRRELSSRIQKLAWIADFFSRNISTSEEISDKDLDYIKKIFAILEELHLEAVVTSSEDYSKKLDFIYEFFVYNSRYETFKSCEYIYYVVRMITTSYYDLVRRGLSLDFFRLFFDSMSYYRKTGKKKSETKKYLLLKGLLEGKKKFYPLHNFKYLSVGYQIVPASYHDNKESSRFKIFYSKSYQLDPVEKE